MRRIEGCAVLARAALVGLVLMPALCLAQLSPASRKEIDGLLRAVGTSGCEFMRGGSSYSAAQAQEHLNQKYEYLVMRDLLASTEEFIDKAATRSSMTGEPYAMRCAAAAPQRCDEWMMARLRSMRQAAAPRQGRTPQGSDYSNDSGTNGRSSINFTRSHKVESGSSVSTTSLSPS